MTRTRDVPPWSAAVEEPEPQRPPTRLHRMRPRHSTTQRAAVAATMVHGLCQAAAVTLAGESRERSGGDRDGSDGGGGGGGGSGGSGGSGGGGGGGGGGDGHGWCHAACGGWRRAASRRAEQRSLRRGGRWGRRGCTGAAINAVAPLEGGGDRAVVQRLAVGGCKGDAAVLPVKDHLVVPHVQRADDATRPLVVEDAEAPHVLVQLVRVVERPHAQRDASAKSSGYWPAASRVRHSPHGQFERQRSRTAAYTEGGRYMNEVPESMIALPICPPSLPAPSWRISCRRGPWPQPPCRGKLRRSQALPWPHGASRRAWRRRTATSRSRRCRRPLAC
eukprot:scaffold39848_cov64-Phaeocystis_antarctica.AAC.3